MMKKTQKTLMTLYAGIIVMALLLVVLFETDVMESGRLAGSNQSEFIATAVMELLSLGGAFLGLRLFKFSAVRSRLMAQKASALLKFGLVRLAFIGIPMLCNTLYYYMYMNPTFGYLAIMLLLCLPFVCPTMSRCIDETSEAL